MITVCSSRSLSSVKNKSLLPKTLGMDFCRSVNDIFVCHGLETYDLLTAFMEEFFHENGLFRDELLGSAIANREHLRFDPKEDYALVDSQNYDETTLANCRFLKKIIRSL